MKVLGIDPGLADTGIGVVHGYGLRIDGFAYGSIATSQKEEQSKRLEIIYTKVLRVLRQEMPDLMVVEDVFSLEKYPKSGILLGKVTGVILLAGCHINVPIREIPVREAKQVLTGNGNASKSQLEKAVRHALKLERAIRPFHASDALGLALIGLFRQNN
jgi:crossover junction endodeoxyribonuclease RuvC